jgi:phosphopantetheine--protein transferase-like protein
LQDIFSPLLPGSAKIVEGAIADLEHLLAPQEAACISQAGSKRRREFACGRIFARRALKSFDPEDRCLLIDADRVPIWPAGLIGSITHSDHYCAVAVARKDQVSAIGIDVEELERVTLDLSEYILLPSEIEGANLHASSIQQRLRHIAVVFSAKETIYKCLYPITRSHLSFHDVHISVSEGLTSFEARLLRSAGTFYMGHCFVGRYVVKNGLVATAIALPCEAISNRQTDRTPQMTC